MKRAQIIQHPTYKRQKRAVDSAMEESAKGNPSPLDLAIRDLQEWLAKAKGE